MALQWTVSFHYAKTIRTVATVDTAYYYVIARNVALGRGLLDTVLWCLIGVPDNVARPAGDYWEIGWPLVLGALMRVFGTSQRAAIVICAVLSGLLPLLTAIVAWLATRRAAVAFLAGLLVILQARLVPTNISTDATLPYQLATLGAFAAFYQARERPLSPRALLAVGASFAAPMYLRGEGFVVALALLPFLLLAGKRARPDHLRRFLHVIAGMAAIVVPFAIRNLVVFHRLVPLPRSLRPWMTSYWDLYAYLSDPSPKTFWSMSRQWMIDARKGSLLIHLDQLTHQVPWPLLALAALGAIVHVAFLRRRGLPLALFPVLSLLVPCLLAPMIAAFDRFVMNVLPVLCVLAAIAVVAVRDAIGRVIRSPILDLALFSAAAAACTFVFREPFTWHRYPDLLAFYRDTPPSLVAAEKLRLTPRDVVLTDDPWRVAAVLDASAIRVPTDGISAAEALVKKYRPRFVLVSNNAVLKGLVAANHIPMKAVLTAKDATWYELSPPVRNADGSAR
jgi:hypothetical protein